MLLDLGGRLRAGIGHSVQFSTWNLVNGSCCQHKHMASLPHVEDTQAQPLTVSFSVSQTQDYAGKLLHSGQGPVIQSAWVHTLREGHYKCVQRPKRK